MASPIVNRVEQSGIIVLDLSEIIPKEELVEFSIESLLDSGQVLREKPFRKALAEMDMGFFHGKHVYITYPKTAILPRWSFMLIISYLQKLTKSVIVGTQEQLRDQIAQKYIDSFTLEGLTDKRVILKGCSASHINEYAYASMTSKLLPLVKTLMYGEPCSSVPVFKRKA